MTSPQPPITPMVPPLVGDRPVLLRRFPLIFLAFTPLALFLDSAGLARQGLELRWLVNSMALLCFATLFAAADRRLKQLLAVMVPLSYVGELIFCEALGWYQYRLNDIPLYVPLGHAIVYGAGYVAAHHPAVLHRDAQVQRACSAAFAALFLGVCLLLGDYFSGLSGLLFFWLIRRKQWQNLYFMIALCVIYIELLGTAFGCWTWAPKIHGHLATANPPMGAVFFYAGGDSLLARIVNGLGRRAAASTGKPAWRLW